MTKQRLREWMLEALALARRDVEEKGELVHMAIGDGPIDAPILTLSDQNRRIWPYMIQLYAALTQSTMMLHVTEAWKAVKTEEEYKEFKKSGRRVESIEDKTEVIIIEGKTKAGVYQQVMQEFERKWDGSGIDWKEMTWSDEGKYERVESRMMDRLWS